jgi:transcriptional regulator with XRE-family HTH domain
MKSPSDDILPGVKKRQLALLGQQIRRLREEKNLSQEQFAGLAGIDRAYYGGIERGERNVAAINIIKIADALGVEVGKLFPPLSTLRRALKGGHDERGAAS